MGKNATSTDVEVGARVRLRRKELGLSQGALGEKVGITFQQIQKYENGMNRIGASRLHAMATALQVPVSYFFPDPGEADGSGAHGLISSGDAVDLLKAFSQIDDKTLRRAVVDLARTLARARRQESPGLENHAAN